VLAGSYDFGVVKVAALYDTLKTDNRATSTKFIDYRSYFVSLSAPVSSAATIKFTTGKVDDKLAATNYDSTKWGIGLDYKLSKRTVVYTDYGSISNSNGAKATISYAANGGNAPNLRSATTGAVKGFDLGIAHSF
jgi:predicted porin